MLIKIIKKLNTEFISLVSFFINFFPGASGSYLRRYFYKVRLNNLGKQFNSEIGLHISYPKNISIGNNFKIMKFSSILACKKSNIKIGDNVAINNNVNINSCNGGYIKIGNNVLIASNVVIRSADHIYNLKNKLIKDSGHNQGKITIGNDVWIGSNSVILKNVNIEDGAIIGAGTVVTKNIKKNEIIIGSKQTKIKNRFA